MEYQFKSFTQADEQVLEDLYHLEVAIFSELTEVWSKEKLAHTATQVADFHIIFAYKEEQPVAFKAGYRASGRRFYSWLGGVKREHRGQGLAKQLMEKQHAWAQEQGYAVVETRTKNRFKNMLITNLNMGFDIVGTTQSIGDTEPVLILEKTILT